MFKVCYQYGAWNAVGYRREKGDGERKGGGDYKNKEEN